MVIVVKHLDFGPPNPAEAAADSVIAGLKAHGFEGYRVGGAVRDRLIGRSPHDADVATDAVPAAVRRVFPHSFAVGESFGVVVVHTADGDVEVATFRADGEYADGRRPAAVRFSDLATDALRRDFTINALFYDPHKHCVVDRVGGLTDLRNGLVRAIGDPERRFSEDRLRMLRAVRFAAGLGFRLHHDTEAAIRRNAAAICTISAERILAELNRILIGPGPARALGLLSETGLLAELLPEVESMHGVQQPPEFHPEGDVWNHTLLMLDHLRWPSPQLAWSVLLHDVGKPVCHTFDGARHRFNGHAQAGVDIVRRIFRRLKAPRRLAECVSSCVAGHMDFMNVKEMRESTLRRMVSRDCFGLELELHRLDCIGSHNLADNYCFVLDRLAEFKNEPVIPARLISGHDLIGMGMRPGPRLGALLDLIQEQQLEGILSSRAEAIEFARSFIAAPNTPA